MRFHSCFFFISSSILLAAFVACGGNGSKGAGDTCSGAEDCTANLTCQPIMNRTGSNYCCATPPESTKNAPTCLPGPIPGTGMEAGAADASHE
jgi:hypothetical protein